MGNDPNAAVGVSTAGRGRLAQVIATRGGQAAPEAPFVIEHREALIYMLCEAAELEHAIMCQYLFAAFSLKQSEDEGLTKAELAATGRWRQQISHVATQEMLHLALVHNLLSAIGAAPQLARPNLPAPASHYPAGVQLALLPFGEQALRHFMFLERPEGMDLADADGLAAVGRAEPVLSERDIVPRGQDFATIGHLYRSIEAGLAHLAAKHSEDWLFVGPPRAQATTAHFGWPELVAVTDLASAQRAIEEILEQGEGPRGHWRKAHFGQFVNILDEYTQLRETHPGFDPVRPVLAANVRPPEGDVDVPLIGDPLTARVTDLFNVGYEILLEIFERFFAHTEETDAQLKTLADTTIGLMFRVIKPLGDLITALPVGDAYPGMTAGPSFELFYESDYLMPHREAAWALLAERLDEAAWLCGQLASGRGQAIAGQLEPVLAAMRELSQTLAAHLPAGRAHARLAAPPARLEAAERDALLGRARDMAASVAARAPGELAGELAGVFERAHAIVASAASGLDCAPEDQALVVSRLVGSVLRPLADALSTIPAAPAGPSLEHCALCRCGHSRNKPFCSGMHWYVGFRDPVPVPGSEPTLFEWAGGLPALTRMSRLLYEKHVPADPLLAPLFADMPPDQARRLATWMGGALGGPAGGNTPGQATGFSSGEINDQQRDRWVTLLATAADEAGLPADAGFRSAFCSCAEWVSRAATAQPQPETAASGQPSAPSWDWGPGGPPATRAAPAAGQADAPDEPPLPGPGQPVGFAAHIKPLFRQRDRQSMSFAFDLWSYADVTTRAQDILERLQNGSMPCDGAWPAAMIEVFRRWTDTGMQP
jgi:truncated hemoglobin YjbI